MNEPGGAPEQRNPRPRILRAIGAAGAILILGVAAASLLTQASPEALAATGWVGITTALVGVIAMIYLVAARPSLSDARDDRRPESGPGPASPVDDMDAELFRILADPRLGDISSRRVHGRARGTG